MCEDCGAETTTAGCKFKNYTIGQVLEVEEMKAPLKKCKVKVDPEVEDAEDDRNL